MISAGTSASTASAMNIGSAPAPAPCGSSRGARCTPGLERRRPVRRLERARCRIEPLQRRRRAVPALRAGRRRLTRPRRRRRRLPLRVAPPRSPRAGSASSASRLDVERDVDARELAVERLRELGGARLQARAHPLALGLADFAEPAVLQRRERREQHEQDDAAISCHGRLARSWNSTARDHCTRNAAANRRALHFLQNDCLEITTSADGALVILARTR